MSSNKKYGVSGLNWRDMRKFPAIIPIQLIIIAGWGLSVGYVLRLATKSPEVTWRRKTNPEPWNDYSCKQYKFLSSGRDYTEGTPAPRYK